MPDVQDAGAQTVLDPLLDLAGSRLLACPLAAQDDLAACLTYLRYTRSRLGAQDGNNAAVDRHIANVITMSSRGLDHHEDRALSLMIMAIAGMRDNLPWSNAQAERTLLRIRLPGGR
jgi:hypothetical protein